MSGSAIAVDSQYNAYVTGIIAPNADQMLSNFPVTPGAFQTAPPSFPVQENMRFAFLAKLNSAGSGLVYSTFLYASTFVTPVALTVDAKGSAIVIGTTYAYDFPTTAGGLHQCYPSASFEARFLFQISADGSQPLYSTYLGADEPTAVAVDSSGEIYIAGNSADALPVVPGSFGWTDDSDGAFALKIAPEPFAPGSVSCVVSAANRGGSAIAPGEIVDIFGIGIGPAQAVSSAVVSGQIPTSLGGTQVLIGGYPAPLFSVGPNQIRAVVPFEVAPAVLGQDQFTTDIQILSATAPVQPATVPVVAASPAIYTVSGNTPGRALMINQDGTLNSQQNPAPQGSVVTIYATGLNNTQPALATGAIATEAVPLAFEGQLQIGNVTGGQITYAGAAPSFVAGLTQINFLIPVLIVHGFSTVDIFLPGGVGSVPVYFYQQ